MSKDANAPISLLMNKTTSLTVLWELGETECNLESRKKCLNEQIHHFDRFFSFISRHIMLRNHFESLSV